MSNARRCSGTNRDGSPCSATVRPDRAWCAWHDPRLETARASWRRKGGEARSNRTRARKALPGDVLTMPELAGALCRALAKVEAGELEPGVATSMATLARAVVAVQHAGEFESRLARLEGQAGIEEGRRS